MNGFRASWVSKNMELGDWNFGPSGSQARNHVNSGAAPRLVGAHFSHSTGEIQQAGLD